MGNRMKTNSLDYQVIAAEGNGGASGDVDVTMWQLFKQFNKKFIYKFSIKSWLLAGFLLHLIYYFYTVNFIPLYTDGA